MSADFFELFGLFRTPATAIALENTGPSTDPYQIMDVEASQIEALIQRKNTSVARIGLRLLAGFQLISFPMDPFLLSNPQRLEVMAYSHVLLLFLVFLAFQLGKRNPLWLLRFTLPICVPFFLSYIYLLHADLMAPGANLPLLKSVLGCSLVGVFIISLSPQSTLRLPTFFTVFFGASVWWLFRNVEDGHAVAGVVMVGYLAALAWKYFQVSGRHHAARLEIKNRELILAAERCRVQLEMDLASAIQDSLRPPESLEVGRLKVQCYMLKHGSVGGDWVAVQARPGGRLFVLVVDATGKGLQAALVVHAVQSLWTAAMVDDVFQPKTWILRVNDVLLKMGQRSAHTVTLALADIRDEQVVFWSAGHGPIYLRQMHKEGAKVSVHFALGNLLGIGPSAELTLKPTIVPLEAGAEQTIFLGTDGVLVGSKSKDVKTIEHLERELPLRGSEALGDGKIEDDKALVRVEFRREGWERVG